MLTAFVAQLEQRSLVLSPPVQPLSTVMAQGNCVWGFVCLFVFLLSGFAQGRQRRSWKHLHEMSVMVMS